MADEKEYKVRAVEEEESIEDAVDQKIQDKMPLSESQVSQTQPPSQPRARRGLKMPQIPTERIFKTMTNKEMMMQTLHDETMEPHVHLIILLFIVFVLAIILALVGI